MPEGTTFKYQELPIQREEYTAATKAIERLIKSGKISRASTGLFYKPKKTIFGLLKPDEENLLRPYLFLNGKRVAYITGTALYNRMGLTTQVPKNVKIASRDKRLALTIGDLKITSIKSYVDISEQNYRYLEILDALKDLKLIPDLDKRAAIRNLASKISELDDKSLFQDLALKYPPRARAFAGALLSYLDENETSGKLKSSINPLSAFNYGLTPDILPTAPNWNIN